MKGPEPGTLIQYFKDDATAFNGEKKGTIKGKGRDQQPHQRIHLDEPLAAYRGHRRTSSAV
jgi:hypothetical protein